MLTILSLLILFLTLHFLNSGFTIVTRLAILISIFVSTSFSFLYLNNYFLGLTYIIVYVGAIAILFIFVIMLINQHLPLPTQPINTSQSHLTSTSPVLLDWLILSQSTSNSSNQSFIGQTPSFAGMSFILICILSSVVTLMIEAGQGEVMLFYPNWILDFQTLTDLMILGYTLFLAYPFSLILLGLLLWILLIGILNIVTDQ